MEDTIATIDEIDEQFGSEVADIVDGVTKISLMNFTSKEAAQAENIRKMILAMAEDIRVILVKLADRLHNMRTLDFQPPLKRQIIAQETMDIYAPLANRLGCTASRIRSRGFFLLPTQAGHLLPVEGRGGPSPGGHGRNLHRQGGGHH